MFSLTRLLTATLYAIIAVSFLVVVITIGGEEYAPLKNWLKMTFTHHWLGKSVLSIITFCGVTGGVYMTGLSRRTNSSRLMYSAISATIISSLCMTGYFILHTLHLV